MINLAVCIVLKSISITLWCTLSSALCPAQQDSGWTWVRDFYVHDHLGVVMPAEGIAGLYWGVEVDDEVAFTPENSIETVLVNGRLELELPLVSQPVMAMLAVIPDPGARMSFAPYLMHFQLWPLVRPTGVEGYVFEQTGPTLLSEVRGLQDAAGAGEAMYQGITVKHPSLQSSSVSAGVMLPETAALFASPGHGWMLNPGSAASLTGDTGGTSPGRIPLGGHLLRLPEQNSGCRDFLRDHARPEAGWWNGF